MSDNPYYVKLPPLLFSFFFPFSFHLYINSLPPFDFYFIVGIATLLCGGLERQGQDCRASPVTAG